MTAALLPLAGPGASLGWAGEGGYSAAVAFRLPPALAGEVERARGALARRLPLGAQHAPHLTLLYLGVMPAAGVAAALRWLRGRDWAPLPVRVTGYGRFVHQGRVRTVYLGVEPSPALRALHDALLDGALEQPWFSLQTEFVRGRFVPHLTVCDGIAAGEDELALPPPPPTRRATLRDPVLIVSPRAPAAAAAARPLTDT